MWKLLRICCALLAAAEVLALAGAAEAKIKVAFVTSESGMGDRSFNDMMDQGMKRAVKDLDIDYVIIQPRSISEFQPSLARAAAQGFDIIVGSSFDMIKPMQAVAAAFPNQKFGLVDVGPDSVAPNVVSSVTKDWEGSFLVGVIAAKVSKTGTIGFVGGKDIPIIHRFFVGYYYGSKMAKPEVKVLESYSGTFTDPAAGKEYTLALVNQGSDINFAVAGATSAGVIDAAKTSNTFAIGVDSDQNYMAPGHVLTSMVKRVDTQAFDMIKSVVDGSFKGGTVHYYGLKEGGVDAAMDEYNKGLIPDDVLRQVDALRQKVISGEIVVPNYFDLKPGAKEMGRPAIETPPSIANAK
jgi:basic membrane protein A and related proteins